MDLLGLTQQLSNYIIRPPRASYSPNDLGQTVFEYKGIIYERIDFSVPPSNNTKKLQCSIYLDKFNKNNIQRPTLIYLHANSSSRLTVKNYLKNLITKFDVVAFDFRGCGLSQGNYLTLGYLEKQDVRAVIQYVDSNFGMRRYILWGRSMGAVTAILYTAKYQINSDKLYALVLDSPFADLQKIIHYLADQKAPLVPSFMISSVIDNIQQYTRQKIQKQYGRTFLIKKHKPIKQITKIRIPTFFVGSKSDQIVECTHLKQYYDNAFCYKQMQILEGGHNQVRPDHLKLAIVQFLLASLNMKRQPVVRKKIFQFGKTSPFSGDKAQNMSMNYGKVDDSNVINANMSFDNNMTKSFQQQTIPNKARSKSKPRVWKNNNTINQLATQQQKFVSKIQQPLNQNKSKIQQEQKNQKLIFFDQYNNKNNQSMNKEVTSQQQILDKVLPKSSSTRRTHRIFTNSNNTTQKSVNM